MTIYFLHPRAYAYGSGCGYWEVLQGHGTSAPDDLPVEEPSDLPARERLFRAEAPPYEMPPEED